MASYQAARSQFSLATTLESSGFGTDALAKHLEAMDAVMPLLRAKHGTEKEREQWMAYCSTAMDHVAELKRLSEHIRGWQDAVTQVEEMLRVARVLESPPGEFVRAATQYDKAVQALLQLTRAVEETTGSGTRGVAASPPWAWFSRDTGRLFERAMRGAEGGVAALERLAARGYLPGAAPGGAAASASASSSPAAGGHARGRALSTEEVEVLRRTSVIQGKTYVPWADEDRTAGFEGPPASFVDPDGPLELSPVQARRFAGWKRPAAALERPCMLLGDRPSAHSVTQELVGTCSFLSSLCAAAEFERRTGVRLISTSIYPQDAAGRPALSPTGRYAVRLHLNGAWRRVVVDDFLPVGRDGRLLCSRSNRGGELWVSLLEKAFLKVVGSYAFAGSTSSKDLHVLTGWLPETLRVDSRSFDAQGSWDRICGGFAAHDVLVTAGTRGLTEEEEERRGLVSRHAYAVLDIREVPVSRHPSLAALAPAGAPSARLLKIKNPWGRRPIRGALAYGSALWTSALRAELGVSDSEASGAAENGVAWCTWAEALEAFGRIYLSWRPVLLPHRTRMHGQWLDAWPGPRKDNHSFYSNPQYRLTVEPTSKAVVWVMVSRHVTAIKTDAQPPEPPSAGGVHVPRGRASAAASKADEDDADYLAVHVYAAEGAIDDGSSYSASSGAAAEVGFGEAHAGAERGDPTSAGAASSGAGARPAVACSSGALAGDRVVFPGDAAVKGVYSGSPYIVSKLTLAAAPGRVPLTLALSQLERRRDVFYTVSVFSSAPCELSSVPRALACFAPPVSGRWGPGRDGGRASRPRYFENPQVQLETTQEDDVQLILRGPSDQSISFRVIANPDGGRVASHRSATVFQPKFYMKCFNSRIRRSLPPGKYAVVLSCWDEGTSGAFELLAAGQSHAPRLTAL